MSYLTEAVILVGRRCGEIEDLLDSDLAEDVVNENILGIDRHQEYEGDGGYCGYVFDTHNFELHDLETFVAQSKLDFKRETGLDAELFLLASWS